MICASRSRVCNALFPVRFEVKERFRRILGVVYYITLGRGEGMGLALGLAHLYPVCNQTYLYSGFDLAVHH